MDPITTTTVASAVLSMLLPYIQKAGDKFAEEVGRSIPDHIGKLYNSIKERFSRKPTAIEAVKDLEKIPSDPDIQAAFRVQLRKLLDEDEYFAEEIKTLLSVTGQKTETFVAQTGSGAIATGEGVASGEKGLAVKGDVHGNITVNKS